MIIRKTKNRFATIPNSLLEDERISIAARGGQAYLLSRHDDWTIRHSHLRRVWGIGKDKFQRIMQELLDAGYLVRSNAAQPRDREGLFRTYDYIVYDVPELASASDHRLPAIGSRKPGHGTNTESNKTDSKIPPSKVSPTEQAELQLVGDELSEFGRHAHERGSVFVFERSGPFEAWRSFRGNDGMPPVVAEKIGGLLRRGVWLPSLHPPRRVQGRG